MSGTSAVKAQVTEPWGDLQPSLIKCPVHKDHLGQSTRGPTHSLLSAHASHSVGLDSNSRCSKTKQTDKKTGKGAWALLT